MNPTQIPFHSAFNLMGSLPPQPQIQPAPAGAAHFMMMPQFQQQQTGVQVPNFLLQAFPQQNGQQWMLPQLQTPPVAPPPPSQGRTAPQQRPDAAPRQYSKQRDDMSSQDDEPSPIGSDPDDEEMLIKTLQKAKARGITPRKALDKLDKVYNHTAREWKDYFLENLERLLPKIYKPAHKSRPYGSTPPVSHPRSPLFTATKSSPVKPAKSQPLILPRGSSLNVTKTAPRTVPSAHGTALGSAAQHVTKGRSTTPTRGKKKASQPLERGSAPAFTSSAVSRTRRGAPIHEFHAGTFIPPSFGVIAPKPSKQDRSQDASKFTDEDKVFFIHFLHWRLGQPGAIPSKHDLYDALGDQTAHHNAEAWKRHWDEHPELPDKIYIEARKRAEEQHLTLEPGQPGYARLAGSIDEESQEDDSGEAAADNASVVSYYDPPNEAATAQPADKIPRNPGKPWKTFKHPITADDLRAMAKYKVEKRHVWDQFDTKQGPWREFAERPEHRSRKLGSWYLATRDRAEELNEFYNQYLTEAEACRTESTPPRQDSEDAYAPSVRVKSEKGTRSPDPNLERPQKRGFERESRTLSPHKRIRQDDSDMREYIEIFDTSD
ncbi:hypothetical protein LXA43DRAFT_914523 [Ganoderma leucocontextum]|nr:hypothetical protein LXA43DRAFT_914523 [Ganoderma leucocontextum]